MKAHFQRLYLVESVLHQTRLSKDWKGLDCLPCFARTSWGWASTLNKGSCQVEETDLKRKSMGTSVFWSHSDSPYIPNLQSEAISSGGIPMLWISKPTHVFFPSCKLSQGSLWRLPCLPLSQIPHHGDPLERTSRPKSGPRTHFFSWTFLSFPFLFHKDTGRINLWLLLPFQWGFLLHKPSEFWWSSLLIRGS